MVARWFTENVPAESSVLLTGSRYGFVQFNRDYRHWTWDGAHGIFIVDNQRAHDWPDWRPDWNKREPFPSGPGSAGAQNPP